MKGSKESLNRLNGYDNELWASASAIGSGVNSLTFKFRCGSCQTDNVKITVEGWKYVVFSCSECSNYEMPPIEEVASAYLGRPEIQEPDHFSIIEDEYERR